MEPAPVDSDMLLGLELIDRHDLASLNVHGWASILCLPLHLGVVEWQYRPTLPCQLQRTSFLCRQGGTGPV